MIPGFGLVRRLLMPLIILAAIGAGASFWVEGQAEQRVASVAQERFGLSKRPRVDIGGGLILVNVFRGELPAVTIEADDVRLRSFDLEQVTLALRDLTFDGGVLGSGDLAVTVGEGEATAIATQDAFNAMLRREKRDARVVLQQDRVRVRARRTIAGVPRTVVATGRFRLRRSTLTFVPQQVTVDGEEPPPGLEQEARRQATFSVRLPRLPGDLSIEQVAVRPGRAVFTSTLKNQKLELSG